MANTTNFNWETPDDTDLVKDGAAAIRTLGSAIDTSLVDLKGGTTGQILSKATNTDMDFTWITNDVGDITEVAAGTGISGGGTSGSVTITNSMATAIDAKGDLIVGTGADTFSRLAVGATNGHVLTVDSSTATGLKYAAVGGGGKVLQVVSTTYSTETIIASTTLTDTGISLAITPTSATSKVLILIQANVYNTRLTVTAANKARLLRGATTLLDWTNDGFNYIEITGATAARLISQSVVQYLDSPATTSSTTYKLQAAAFSTANSGQVIFQNGNLPSVITLLEIGA